MSPSVWRLQDWETAKTQGPLPPIRPNSFLWLVMSPDPGPAAEAGAEGDDPPSGEPSA